MIMYKYTLSAYSHHWHCLVLSLMRLNKQLTVLHLFAIELIEKTQSSDSLCIYVRVKQQKLLLAAKAIYLLKWSIIVQLTSWKLLSNEVLSSTGSWSHRLDMSLSNDKLLGNSPLRWTRDNHNKRWSHSIVPTCLNCL